jgi:cytoskeletal protein CcmA (bactofilin family)
MFGKKANNPQSRISSLIGEETVIEGNLNFSGGMRIDGVVNGNISSAAGKPSTLVLSEQAVVNGEVNVTHLVVNGKINGSVTTSEYLELQPKAVINGDIHYKTIELHLGAIVEGRLLHTADAVQDKIVAFKSSSGG